MLMTADVGFDVSLGWPARPAVRVGASVSVYIELQQGVWPPTARVKG